MRFVPPTFCPPTYYVLDLLNDCFWTHNDIKHNNAQVA